MAPSSKVVVRLADDERDALDRLVRTGTHPAAMRRRAGILLKADADGPDAWTDEEIAEHLETTRMTVMRVRQQFAAEGLDPTLHRKKPTGRQYRKLDGKQEAQLVALACSAAPDGRARWTMTLLADKLVEMKVVGSIDPATVWRTLKKFGQAVAPAAVGPPADGECGIRSEHGGRARHLREAARPEAAGGLRGRGRQATRRGRPPPLPVRAGSPAKEDYEYQRNGVANLFLAFEPLAGWRHAEVTERKTSKDFARFLRVLSEDRYPAADRIVLVCDNLSTHTPAALYEAFAPAAARRLAERFEWHYTPRHGSWLNVAEMELSVLARQCLDRRIPDLETLRREVARVGAGPERGGGDGRLAVHDRRRPGQTEAALPND